MPLTADMRGQRMERPDRGCTRGGGTAGNPETAPRHDGEDVNLQCWQCGRELWPDGTCSRCRPPTEGLFDDETTVSRRGRITSDQLTHRLVDLAPGRRPRCGDGETSHYWTSEDLKERALAASWCTGCDAFAECDASAPANRERFGTRAGRDRTRPPGKAAAA